MNGINRAGQKVRCIAYIDVVTPFGGKYSGPVPEVDQVYTVASFAESGRVELDDGTVIGSEGIELVEISSPRRPTANAMGWPIMAFEPLDERSTDISDMIAFCLGSTVRETEPA